MNDSAEFQPFLNGNFGALVFIVTYIGFYGLNLIVYFSYQFMNDNSNSCEDEEISNEFFSTLHHINERQQIYSEKKFKGYSIFLISFKIFRSID